MEFFLFDIKTNSYQQGRKNKHLVIWVEKFYCSIAEAKVVDKNAVLCDCFTCLRVLDQKPDEPKPRDAWRKGKIECFFPSGIETIILDCVRPPSLDLGTRIVYL